MNAACACGERTTRIVRTGAGHVGSASAPKRSLPVTFARASSRATRAPTARPASASTASTTTPRDAARTASTILRVAGAAAQDAGERVAAPRSRLGLGLARSSVGSAHQHARRADAALRRAVRHERALQRRERTVGAGETFDRRHRAPVALADADDARADLLAIEQHRARTAIAGVAADLGAGQAELVAQGVGETPRRVAGELARAAVDVDADDLDRGQVARGHGVAAKLFKTRRSSVAVASKRYAALARRSSIAASGARSAGSSKPARSACAEAPTRRRSSAGRRRAAAAQLPTAAPAPMIAPFWSVSTTTATVVTAIVR